jgi:hypothetical protein
MRGRSRKDSCSPLSASWTLYKPEEVQKKINEMVFGDMKIEEINKILEETGFNKAVRIREELIKRKVELGRDSSRIRKKINHHQSILDTLKKNLYMKELVIWEIRQALRIPRENKNKTGVWK